jgi:hypothetical protein
MEIGAQVGNDVVFTFMQSGSLTLENIQLTSLHPDDFLFG